MIQREARGVPLRLQYGDGIYRRRIRVLVRGPEVVVGELEDDFHHFRATLFHDGTRVTRAEGAALRVPWTTCPSAIRPLARLVGLPLSASLRAGAKHTDARAQCTHLFDAACLAAAFVACGASKSGSRERVYDATVPDRVDGRTCATLSVDGAPVLAWDVEGNGIVAPEIFAGQTLSGGGFGRWAESELAPEDAVHALVLQKALFISAGRRYAFDEIDRASAFAEAVGGACHTFSPAFQPLATRVYGSVRDFTDAPDAPLADPPEPIDPDAPVAGALPRVLFVCVENANRSQMAEAFAHMHGDHALVAYSAGSKPSGRVNERAVLAMRELGYDLSAHRSKSLAEIPDLQWDFVATMGCGDACPTVRARHREDWEIRDPKDMSPDALREVRDEIEQRVLGLIARLSATVEP